MTEQEKDQQEEFVTVPKGTTVNKEKYERAVAAKEAAEARMSELEQQIAALTADKGNAQTALEEFQAQVAKEAEEYKAERAKLENELAMKDKVAELLRAECIDPESGIASLKEGETIEQLRDRKPHLFKQPTKQSSLTPKDQPKSADDALLSDVRKAMGL